GEERVVVLPRARAARVALPDLTRDAFGAPGVGAVRVLELDAQLLGGRVARLELALHELEVAGQVLEREVDLRELLEVVERGGDRRHCVPYRATRSRTAARPFSTWFVKSSRMSERPSAIMAMRSRPRPQAITGDVTPWGRQTSGLKTPA